MTTTDITIKQLAALSAQSPDELLKRINEAGIAVDAIDAPLSAEQKSKVLAVLRPAKRRTSGKLSLGGGKKVEAPAPSAEPTPTASTKVKVTVRKRTIKKPILSAPAPKKPPVPEAPKVEVKVVEPMAPESPVVPKKAEESVPVKQDSKATPASAAPADDEAKKKHGTRKAFGKEKARKTEYLLEKDLESSSKFKHRKKRTTRKEHQKAVETIKHDFEKPVAPMQYTVEVPESIRVSDLAKKMSANAADVIKKMMSMGAMVTINQVLDQDTAVLVVEEMGHKAVALKDNALEEALISDAEDESLDLHPRAPVVTIMGHVDHGKTSLLDFIRASQLTSREAGGITQHIGAYQVSTSHGQITFLDTPGHEAFTAMRARGAQCTDIVILVVAADDGVMPQTIEAIQHAKAAGVPIIVAINKMDKPEADPERVKTELASHGVVSEDWGGDTIFQPISAKTGDGVTALLDSISLQAEVLELKAPSEGAVKGIVIESSMDRGRGVVVTLMVQSGTLKRGDYLLAGKSVGRVRAMLDDHGKRIDEAGPSVPVAVLGFSDAPSAGDSVLNVTDEKRAREVALFRQGQYRDVKFARQSASLDTIFTQMSQGQVSKLNVILKTDVQGSLEAIMDALNKLSTDEVKVKCIVSGVGGINSSDVQLAVASNAIIIGFNVRADQAAAELIEREKIDLHYYSVIYQLIDEVKSALSGLLAPEVKEEILGVALVKEVYRSSKMGSIAGCQVSSGRVKQGSKIRVLRDHVVVFTGELESLRHYKEAVKEVKYGDECGIGVKDYNDVKTGDEIESYQIVEIKRTL